MKTCLITASIAAICLGTGIANAAGPDDACGPYAGVGAGFSGSDLRQQGGRQARDDQWGGALKLFAGYQINRHFGIEGGYLRTGRFAQTVQVNGVDVREEVKSHAWYVAGTARLPVGERFALTATGGMAFGHVSLDGTTDSPVPSELTLRGSRRSVLAGIGGQYRITPSTDLQFDLTGIDAVSRGLEVGTITLTVRTRF